MEEKFNKREEEFINKIKEDLGDSSEEIAKGFLKLSKSEKLAFTTAIGLRTVITTFDKEDVMAVTLLLTELLEANPIPANLLCLSISTKIKEKMKQEEEEKKEEN